MKLKRLFALATAIVLLVMTVGSALAATIKTTESMHIRKGPGEKYSIVATISSGSVLKVKKAGSSDGTLWFKITSGRYKGRYISSQKTTTVKSNVDVYVKTTGTVNFRTKPTKYSSLIRKFGSGHTLHCTGYRNGWFRIRYNGTTGYIYGYKLKPA